MLRQAFNSVEVGSLISLALFVPFVIWQYRRFGRPSAGRLIGYGCGLIYLTALLAYTLFPLPNMSDGYCLTHHHSPVIDPTRYFRDMADTYSGRPAWEVIRSWELLQMVLNVALFVPLGVFSRRLFMVPVSSAVGAGLGASLLIEMTQLTGNWGLMPCAYRQADVNDLITNTAGTVAGICLATVLPRLVADPAYLMSQRRQARPITITRRWTGMLLDVWYWAIVAGTTIAVGLVITMGIVLDVRALTSQQWRLAVMWCSIVALIIGLVLVVVPAMTPNGGSLGQRTVYLQPFSRHGRRWRRVVRALSVQAIALVGALVMPWPIAIPALVWTMAAVVSVALVPRGLSCLVSGCDLRDSRDLLSNNPMFDPPR